MTCKVIRLLKWDFRATVTSNGPLYATGPLSCLSVTLVYCDQTVGWIKMPLRTEVGLVPGHVVLDADPAPAKKGVQQPPTFRPMSFRPMSIVVKRSPISATADLLYKLVCSNVALLLNRDS